MENLLQTLRNLGPVRLGAIGGVALLILALFGFLLFNGSSPNMALLYSDLSPSDGGAIVQQLDQMQPKVPYQVSPDSTRIEVPADQVGRIRMLMAQQGLPTGGNVGYEIFNQAESLGTTSFMQSVQQLRALEGELSRTVNTLAPVQQSRIHLVLPKRELFSRETQKATASVVLRLRPGQQLKKEQVASVQHLIAASVPGLQPDMVSVVDDKGNLLARGMGSDSKEAMMATAEEKRLAYQQRLTDKVEEIVGRTVGMGKVRAEVTVDMDFDHITTNSEIFDPDSQVVRSTETNNENSEDINKEGQDPVTVANNLPSANAENTTNGSSSSKTTKTNERINYEISKTVKVHEREAGQVRRLSVAVLVDGNYVPDDKGVAQYQPRSDDELQKLGSLVKSSIGFDGSRGDTVDVVSMKFATPEGELEAKEETLFGLPKQDVFRIAETIVLAIVAILVILLVIRPLVARALDRTPQLDEEPDLLSDQSGVPQLAGPGGGALARELALEAAQANEELEQMIDINRVDGRVRASSLRKVGEIVEKHPEEAVSIIRNWLYQEN
ncbi:MULTISPECIES: flagellar basal-body MS-ring/collar protein FliF [Nitrospirillum]|uniref:Flagellar M-ring protein n=3 Tax=Nitrospirillum TaxID=1543705 RepID=A0A248JQE7_9PROT|nr:flagellar basal-body MS-ring/collar protein FliF [Nitrospirillum amazonense]ASG20925.1 flagellar M-ring protein FliF [Nitrospirillum amazonense CBAmc]MDG3441863.1 flagellar basal-body MS-ring/collar protein FliF [Nitrospirillum amazonense]TWB16651.1 flagellar M-ring protein FliF [Nitrospirillum amazonense]TWB37728.1 flagellar M-ring protein FliF [Nitrospirillum amazonense]TWB48814.1 flagellar M-ring protein FliF [Nitrospirillum amazonense]